MNYSKVPFKTVQAEIKRIFNCGHSPKELNLTPDEISRLAELNGIELKWTPIFNWDNEDYNFSDEEFFEIAFLKNFTSERIFLITDECFNDKMAFFVAPVDLIPFIEHVYNGEFKMEFPQPSDFIFIQPATNLITMIHHEGMRTKYIKS